VCYYFAGLRQDTVEDANITELLLEAYETAKQVMMLMMTRVMVVMMMMVMVMLVVMVVMMVVEMAAASLRIMIHAYKPSSYVPGG
jgi:molybdopterin synthase catalytic subunit